MWKRTRWQLHAERALQKSEQRFRGTFENAAVGIAHLDAEGRCLRANEKLCDIIGYLDQDLIGKPIVDVMHPDDLADTLSVFGHLASGDIPCFTMERRFVRKDNSLVWTYLTVSLQHDCSAAGLGSRAAAANWPAEQDPEGKPECFIAVVQNISDRKRLEAELLRAKEAAETANRAKDEFLANVSHEIRTPMNAILGMIQLALDASLSDDQRQCLQTAQSAADNLLVIINDLLDFSKIEAGKLELNPSDFFLRAAVGDTARALAIRAHGRKGLELVCHVQPDVPDALVGDAGRLRQVLLNLIGNAIKFTDKGEVVVRVEADDGHGAEREAGTTHRNGPQGASHGWCAPPSPPEGTVGLRFTVSDTGIGISPDKQQTIFRAFEQADNSTTRKYGGTGLGLTIAARLVALMGGTIRVESEPGRGSTFVFTAQFARQIRIPESLAARPAPVLHNLPVLIVDDNATSRDVLEQWLRSWQAEPMAAGDGMTAISALQGRNGNGQPIPLVLLDASMPEVDGLTVAAMIRKTPGLAATRIILLTSWDRPDDPDRSGGLRIDGHLLKPIEQDELLETICRVMSRSDCSAGEGALPCEGTKAAAEQAGNAPSTSRLLPAQAIVRAPVPPAGHPAIGTNRDHAGCRVALHVLVAEDDELSRQVLEHMLIRQGHRVWLASNGREALALAEEGGYDLLILDVHMPELDGFQIVQAVRERERTENVHLPVIALTARSRKEDCQRCLAAGMDDFLTKPVRPADLWKAIERVLKPRSPRRPACSAAAFVPGRGETPSPAEQSDLDLLDAPVLLAACGGDATLLGKMCRSLESQVPRHLAVIHDALRDRDALRLRETAHKCCGVLSMFSTVAGDLAGSLEDFATGAKLDKAPPILAQLETLAPELLKQVAGLSIGALRRKEGVLRPRPLTCTSPSP